MIIDLKYKGDKISEIGVCIPDFYKFITFWPGNGEKVDWGEGVPKYKETDTLRDEELCDFACNVVYNSFIQKEGYKVLFGSNLLNAAPNFALEKDGKLIFLIVRGGRAPNMPTLYNQEKEFFIEHAKNQGAELYFAPVGFGAADPVRFDKEIFLRGDGFYANFKGIEPIK